MVNIVSVKHHETMQTHIQKWSFGVTCWEVFNGGKAPYAGVDSTDLVCHLESGKRLESLTTVPALMTCESHACDQLNH